MKMKYEGYWGIDVSKEWVDIAIEGQVTRVEQKEEALHEFISREKGLGILCVLESTGGYEKKVIRCLEVHGITVHVAHPNKVVSFAKARGRLAKTDAIDARMLADYGRFIRTEEIRMPLSAEQETLQMLGARVEQLKGILHQETCRNGLVKDPRIKQSMETLMTLIKKEIKEIQERILEIVNGDATLKETFKLLKSMKGVGVNTALALIIDLPELGHANKKQIAALVGVAPITRQSGQKTGKGFIHYGRAMVRRVLYMAALVACRYNPRMQAFYQHLVNTGKPKKVAIVAVMRKMIVTLNAMMQTKTCFNA